MQKRKNNLWTKDQEEIIIREYPFGDLKQLSKKFNVTLKALQMKAKRLNIKRKIWNNQNSNNGAWKGDNVSYTSLHQWIRNHKPKPELCEECRKIKPYDLANISGKYRRDINDFEWLCRKCHMKKDNRLEFLHNAGFQKGQKSWNKGLTKETDKRMKRISKKSIGRKRDNLGRWKTAK
jgi:hypothetical protein